MGLKMFLYIYIGTEIHKVQTPLTSCYFEIFQSYGNDRHKVVFEACAIVSIWTKDIR